MAKKNLATGIDIGTASVKVVTLMWTDRGKVEVRRATKCDVDAPSIPPTPEDLRKLQAAALKKALAEHRTARGRLVTAIPREDAVIRYLSLPSVKDAEIDEMLRYDVERHVPFSLDQMEMSYQIIGRRGDAESEIMLVAVPDDRMNDHIEILEQAGLDPDVIDVSVLGTCQAYMNGSPQNRVRAVVNIGRTSTEIGFFREGVVRNSRSLPIGLVRLHEMAREAGGVLDEAFPSFERLDGPEGAVKQEWIRRLVSELSRTIQAFRHESHNPAPEILILCGGLAGAPGLAARLSHELGIRAEMMQPLIGETSLPVLPPPDSMPPLPAPAEGAAPTAATTRDLPVSMAVEPETHAELVALDEFTGVAPQPKAAIQSKIHATSSVAVSPMPEFAMAVGLAMRVARAGDKPLNMLPERIVRHRESVHKNRFLRTCAMLLLVIAVEGAGVLFMEYQNRRSQIVALEEKIAEIQPKIDEIEEAKDQLGLIDQYRDAENSFWKILQDIYLKTPEGVQYTEILFTKQKEIRLQGVVYTQEAANELRKYIAESEYFKDVSIPIARVAPPGVPTLDKNMTIVQFEMLCKIRSADNRKTRRTR